jgi:hypothetical protein
MPRYFFDIKDGHKLIDLSGTDCKNDTDAVNKAKVIAIGVSLDRPVDDPARHIVVTDDAGREIPGYLYIPCLQQNIRPGNQATRSYVGACS